MTVASGVMMSVFVSPVIAAVSVGKEETAAQATPSSLHSKYSDKRAK